MLQFEKTAAAAASLGQVHQATSHDGAALACKLQYPDMANAVEGDLKQLKLILSLYERYDNAISTGEIHQELADRLAEELDYRREAANMRLYGLMLKDEPGANVPTPVEDLSSDRLLTMSWINGTRLKSFIETTLTKTNATRLPSICSEHGMCRSIIMALFTVIRTLAITPLPMMDR